MVSFKVSDMTCGHCAQTVEREIKAADPAARVDVDLATKLVRIESGVEPAQLAAAIEKAGYTPQAA